MDQVDQHILDVCKQLECSFVEEHDSLANFSTENTVEFLIRCLWSITPSTVKEIPSCKLPPSISSRFKLASLIAEKLQEAKVAGGYGYQTLLYGNVTDLRKIFLDVIEKLPRKQDAEEEKPCDDSILALAAHYAGERELWVPEFCRRMKMRHDGRFWCPGEGDGDLFPFWNMKGDLWSAVKEEESRSWIAGLIRSEEAAVGVTEEGKRVTGKPPLAPKPPLPPKPSTKASPEENEREAKIASARAKLAELLQANDTKRKTIVEAHLRIKKQGKEIEKLKPTAERERLLALLTNPVEGKEQILNHLSAADSRVADLEAQWEEVRAAKQRELDSLRAEKGISGKIDKMLKEIADKKEEIKAIAEQKEYSNILKEKLAARVAKMGDDTVNRDAITKRIFEMTASLKKQKEELNKVLQENSAIQKEMSWISQSLYRSFNIIEETLYRDTESYKGEQAYRLFGRINVKCNSSMEFIEKNGALLRQIEHATDQLEIERQKNYSSQLERILRDLESVQQENRSLETQLQTPVC